MKYHLLNRDGFKLNVTMCSLQLLQPVKASICRTKFTVKYLNRHDNNLRKVSSTSRYNFLAYQKTLFSIVSLSSYLNETVILAMWFHDSLVLDDGMVTHEISLQQMKLLLRFLVDRDTSNLYHDFTQTFSPPFFFRYTYLARLIYVVGLNPIQSISPTN